MTTPRTRRTAALAVFLSLGLALTACGAQADSGGAGGGAAGTSCVDTSGPTIKVGFLNSRTGTTASSENMVFNALKMASDEINAGGGVLGKRLTVVAQDGASDPTVFASKAQGLIRGDCVAAVFGGFTSASRKAMLPVFEGNDALLFYPAAAEGMESSKNIFYTGATPNQQIVPALDYLKQKGVKSLFLMAEDSAYPQTVNKIVKAYAAANGMEIRGEEYAPLGSADFSGLVGKIKRVGAGAVFNTLGGAADVAFFQEYKKDGLTAEKMPVLNVSLAEQDIGGIGVGNVVGQPVAANYFQTINSPQNARFVQHFKAVFGADKSTSDTVEAAYTSLYLWKGMVEKAKSFAVPDVQAAAGGVSYDAPEGKVTVDGDNHYVSRTALIGKIGPDGLITTDSSSGKPIEPDPFLKTYPWSAAVNS